MKKNRKMLGLAAAALLAVAPVATSVIPSSANVNTVQAAEKKDSNKSKAATKSTSSTKVTYLPANTAADQVRFSYNNGETKTNGESVGNVSAQGFKNVDDIVKAINTNLKYYSTQDVNNYISANITAQQVTDQLNGIPNKNFTIDGKGNISGNLPENFDIVVNALNVSNVAVASVKVPFYTTATPAPETDLPQIRVTEGTSAATPVPNNGAYYTVDAGSNFNPLSFTTSGGTHVSFSAVQTSSNQAPASISATSNPVNTSEEGRFYTVTLTASNSANKTKTYSYTVLVVSNGQQTLNVDTQTYRIYGGEVQSTGNTLKAGSKIYVGSTTRSINNVSYTKVSTTSKSDANSDSNNLWVPTASLTAKAGDTNVKTYPVMITSRAYDKDGNYLGHTYNAYDNIDIVPTVVTIKGKTYYKVANKDEYVRVTNITGTQRTLRHNAYIYWSSYRRTPGTGKMYRGQTVTTYGASMRFRNGKKYYRIEGCRNNNKRYIKAANF